MEIPEFDIFKRIENLEEKIKEQQVPMDSVARIALFGLIYSFMAFSLHDPKSARKCKDGILIKLREVGLDKRVLDGLEEMLIPLVEHLEEMK